MTINEITGDVIDTAIHMHRDIGGGLLESVYEQVLVAELSRRGHSVERQKEVSFTYSGMRFDNVH